MNLLFSVLTGKEPINPSIPSPEITSVWKQFFSIGLDGWAISIHIGPILYILIFVGLLVLLWWNRRKFPTLFRQFELIEAEATIFGLPKFTVRANRENVRIAYEAWIELITRKAGLPFDEENDTIVDIYSSWYDLFGKLRCLAKTAPAHRLASCADTQKLVEIMVDVMNEGLRPHLTQWQAKFRRWYDNYALENPGKAPQALQKDFSDYSALVADLKKVNKGIVIYTNWLHEIARCDERPKKSADAK
jgi:hypothetical protein